MKAKKVRIKVWTVTGETQVYGPFFSKKEADECRSYNTNGWGTVRSKTVMAVVASDRKTPRRLAIAA